MTAIEWADNCIWGFVGRLDFEEIRARVKWLGRFFGFDELEQLHEDDL